jgi:hypothetical protein
MFGFQGVVVFLRVGWSVAQRLQVTVVPVQESDVLAVVGSWADGDMEWFDGHEAPLSSADRKKLAEAIGGVEPPRRKFPKEPEGRNPRTSPVPPRGFRDHILIRDNISDSEGVHKMIERLNLRCQKSGTMSKGRAYMWLCSRPEIDAPASSVEIQQAVRQVEYLEKMCPQVCRHARDGGVFVISAVDSPAFAQSRDWAEIRSLPECSTVKCEDRCYVSNVPQVSWYGWAQIAEQAVSAMQAHSQCGRHAANLSARTGSIQAGENFPAEDRDLAEDPTPEPEATRLPDEDYESCRPPTQAQKNQVHKIHDNCGHPQKEDFLRALRFGRANPDVLSYVRKEFRCEACAARGTLPKSRRPAALPRTFTFNQVVGINLVEVPSPSGGTTVCCNMICWGTLFQLVVPVTDKSAAGAETAQCFVDNWVRYFGPPSVLVADQGREFMNFIRHVNEMQCCCILLM